MEMIEIINVSTNKTTKVRRAPCLSSRSIMGLNSHAKTSASKKGPMTIRKKSRHEITTSSKIKLK
ncbi:hypothetical protein EBR21_01380 [bacterium]|nr:hypothetical protein [bacterium]